MKVRLQVEGIEAAQKRLRKEVRKVGGQNSEKFVTLSAKAVEARSAPYVPVDTSLLINSAYTQVKEGPDGFTATFGYGADYAGPVHDGGAKNWQKSGASDLFLAKGVEDFINEDLDAYIGAFLGE